MEGEMLIYKQFDEIDESIGYKKITLRDIDEEVVLYKLKDVEDNKDSIILGYVKHNKDVSELEEDNNYLHQQCNIRHDGRTDGTYDIGGHENRYLPLRT